MARRRGGEAPKLPFGGVDIGEEVVIGDDKWERLVPSGMFIVEVCFGGSSVGLGTEDWFAVLVEEVVPSQSGGWFLRGVSLGSESDFFAEEVNAILSDGGGVHLCKEDGCMFGDPTTTIHATRVRFWPVEFFAAPYVTSEGKKILGNKRRELTKALKERDKEKDKSKEIGQSQQ